MISLILTKPNFDVETLLFDPKTLKVVAVCVQAFAQYVPANVVQLQLVAFLMLPVVCLPCT